jgi:hypothetical protein
MSGVRDWPPGLLTAAAIILATVVFPVPENPVKR